MLAQQLARKSYNTVGNGPTYSHSFYHSRLQCEPPSVLTAQRHPGTWICPGKRLHSCAAHKQSSHPAMQNSMVTGSTSYHADTIQMSNAAVCKALVVDLAEGNVVEGWESVGNSCVAQTPCASTYSKMT